MNTALDEAVQQGPSSWQVGVDWKQPLEQVERRLRRLVDFVEAEEQRGDR